MNYLEEYNELIKNGEVIVGYWIRKEVQKENKQNETIKQSIRHTKLHLL